MLGDNSGTEGTLQETNRSGSGAQIARVPWASAGTSLLATTKRAGCAKRFGADSNRTLHGNGAFHSTFLFYPADSLWATRDLLFSDRNICPETGAVSDSGRVSIPAIRLPSENSSIL